MEGHYIKPELEEPILNFRSHITSCKALVNKLAKESNISADNEDLDVLRPTLTLMATKIRTLSPDARQAMKTIATMEQDITVSRRRMKSLQASLDFMKSPQSYARKALTTAMIPEKDLEEIDFDATDTELLETTADLDMHVSPKSDDYSSSSNKETSSSSTTTMVPKILSSTQTTSEDLPVEIPAIPIPHVSPGCVRKRPGTQSVKPKRKAASSTFTLDASSKHAKYALLTDSDHSDNNL